MLCTDRGVSKLYCCLILLEHHAEILSLRGNKLVVDNLIRDAKGGTFVHVITQHKLNDLTKRHSPSSRFAASGSTWVLWLRILLKRHPIMYDGIQPLKMLQTSQPNCQRLTGLFES